MSTTVPADHKLVLWPGFHPSVDIVQEMQGQTMRMIRRWIPVEKQFVGEFVKMIRR
jgi:hypothetical protein